jgi:hypothetical protein
MPFVPSGDIIERLKRHLGLDEKTDAIFKIWEKELGQLAQGVKLIGIKDGNLLAEAESNVHLQELTLRRREFVKKINQYFGNEKVIKTIKIRLK